MPKLIINLNGTGGLCDFYHGDKPFSTAKSNLRYLGAEGQMAGGIFDPIKLYGYLSPACNTTKEVTGTTSFLITSKLIYSPPTGHPAYFADEAVTGTRGQILKLSTADDISLENAYTIAVHGSPNQYSRADDMCVYQYNGVPSIFFIRRNTTTSMFVDILAYTSNLFTDVGSAGTLTGAIAAASRNKLILSDNGFLYILRANVVDKFDGGITGGATGKLTLGVLQFLGIGAAQSGQVTSLIDAVDLRGRMWIGLHPVGLFNPETHPSESYNFVRENLVGVYIWDRQTTVASMQDYVPIRNAKEMKCMFAFQGVPACFTKSIDDYTEIRGWNGSEFPILVTLGKNAYPPFGKHSIEVVGDLVYWIGNDGIIYAYGKITPKDSNALYKIGDITGHVTSPATFASAGILLALNKTEASTAGYNTNPLAFYISFKDSEGANYMKKFYPHAYKPANIDQKANTTENFTLVKFLPKFSTVGGIFLRYPSVGSGGSTALLTLKVYLNQSTTAFKSVSLTQDDALRGWKYIQMGKTNVNAIQLSFTWGVQNIADNITPYMAEIDYIETNKLM